MENGEENYRRYLTGDDEGIFELIRDYKDGLIFYINGIVGNYFLAEELMQDTFTKLAINKPRFFGRSNFKTWLYTIGRNLALDAVRRQKQPTVPLDEIENYISDAVSMENEYLRTERNVEIRRAMYSLNPEYSQSLWLVYIEGFSYKDAAKIMKKTAKQFDSLIYKAKKSLKNELEREGFVYEEL